MPGGQGGRSCSSGLIPFPSIFLTSFSCPLRFIIISPIQVGSALFLLNNILNLSINNWLKMITVAYSTQADHSNGTQDREGSSAENRLLLPVFEPFQLMFTHEPQTGPLVSDPSFVFSSLAST